MSDKQFEECCLILATHFEINGIRHDLLDNAQYSYNGTCAGIRWREEDVFIPEELFSTFGITPLRERKREPIVFEAIVKGDRLPFSFLGNVPEGIPLGTKFKCVEILEED